MRSKNLMSNINITILVQGPLDSRNFHIVIDSIVSIFNDSRIIISTWKNFETIARLYESKNIDIILNDDPGKDISSVFLNETSKDYELDSNSHRMFLSSLAGLKIVKTEWVLRIRSDILINDGKFINEYLISNLKSPTFDSKILVSKVVDSKYIEKFFIDDWIEFGKTKDILSLFNNAYTNIFGGKIYDIKDRIVINNHVFAEKILWNSVFENLNLLSNKEIFERFVQDNILIINNFNNRIFTNLKYYKHNSFIYSLFHDISYKRHYELRNKFFNIRRKIVQSLRLLNKVLKIFRKNT